MNPAKKSKQPGARRAKNPSLPSRDEILEFVENSPGFVGKREIARAFAVKGADRIDLKKMLREMTDDGLLSGRRKRITKKGRLPSVTLIDIVSRDGDGELIALPARWDDDTEPPRILLSSAGEGRAIAAGIGDRALARLSPLEKEDPSGAAYEARIIKKLAREPARLLGVFRSIEGEGGVIDPIDKKHMREWQVGRHDTSDARTGDLVRFEITRSRRGYGHSIAKVIEVIGNPESEGAASLIALHSLGLRDEFPPSVLEEADSLKAPPPKKHEDLRDIPFITIDPEDARDHDDAVWAARDDDPGNPDGWIVCVAIADVAWFVRPGSALDKEALLRGNSIYFPDRVVPMLPERISNNLCSLRENEDRSCLCVRMTFDASGAKTGHRFMRGTMRSRARLSYVQAQAAIDGNPDNKTMALLEPILKPLWQAYGVLSAARDRRAPLDLDLPERKIILGDDGKVADIVVPPRLEAHRLIEEFMIQANVSAAEAVERTRLPLIYRVHDAPSKEKIIALKEFLSTLSMSLPSTGRLKPEHFNRILAQSEDDGMGQLVSEVVLRSQAQAEYSTDNAGHFGLNLRRYTHFTSPIRRYADLVVHRALIRAHELAEGELADSEIEKLEETAESISVCERRAIDAERQTKDRLIAAFLADRVGATFHGRVAGVAKTGLFVRLDGTGADGFVPASSIHDDFYRHDEHGHAMVGERTGRAYRIGDHVEVRLIEAVPSAGALRFEMLTEAAYRAETDTRKAKVSPRRKKGKNRASRRRQRKT